VISAASASINQAAAKNSGVQYIEGIGIRHRNSRVAK